MVWAALQDEDVQDCLPHSAAASGQELHLQGKRTHHKACCNFSWQY